MPTLQIEANLSLEDLMRAAGQLDETELITLETGVRQLLARRQTAVAEADEPTLLAIVNRTWPASAQSRYDDLIAKRDAENLTPAEHAELMALGDQQEVIWATRLAAAAELARRRGVPLREAMGQLGLSGVGIPA